MNYDLSSVLKQVYFGNSVQAYGTAFVYFLLVLVAAMLIRAVLASRLKWLAAKTKFGFDDFVAELAGMIRMTELSVLALYLATRSLTLTPTLNKVIHIALVVALTWRAATLLQAIVAYGVRVASEKKEAEDPQISSVAKNARLALTGLVWTGAVLFVLDNLGVNITAAVAGLGIGGIAVAMAAQKILGDLFSSFVIFIDKPFKVGDFIIVGDLMGSVEHVGIKTTRIRSLGGEMLVFSNSDLTSARIRNYKLMEKRRVVFGFGVTYQTPKDKVEAIPGLIKEIVSRNETVAFDRAHFKGFGESALEFEVVYNVLSGDYNLYMDIQQAINLGMMEKFEELGIEFAYPTRTLHVHQRTATAVS